MHINYDNKTFHYCLCEHDFYSFMAYLGISEEEDLYNRFLEDYDIERIHKAYNRQDQMNYIEMYLEEGKFGEEWEQFVKEFFGHIIDWYFEKCPSSKQRHLNHIIQFYYEEELEDYGYSYYDWLEDNR